MESLRREALTSDALSRIWVISSAAARCPAAQKLVARANFVWLIFVGGIHEHQSCHTVGVIGREDASVESAAGRSYQHHRSANPTAGEQFGQLARDAAGCPRRRAGIAVAHPSEGNSAYEASVSNANQTLALSFEGYCEDGARLFDRKQYGNSADLHPRWWANLLALSYIIAPHMATSLLICHA